MTARTASEDKYIVDRYLINKIDLDIGKTTNDKIMKEILEAKALTYKPFKKAILDTKTGTLVQATLDTFWGVGISDENNVNHTKKSYFKG